MSSYACIRNGPLCQNRIKGSSKEDANINRFCQRRAENFEIAEIPAGGDLKYYNSLFLCSHLAGLHPRRVRLHPVSLLKKHHICQGLIFWGVLLFRMNVPLPKHNFARAGQNHGICFSRVAGHTSYSRLLGVRVLQTQILGSSSPVSQSGA